ncbi:MAG TPA: addiction module protein [Pyrinomonadaceae bacterium]|jgi:hypothetical protein|nr:addiction module protein [Pyrinomonadaceae bacterium]
MSTEFEKLKEDLLMLPQESRASLASALIESLDEGVDADVESWIEEVRRRDAEIRAGTAKLIPAEQAIREARELLKCLK